MRLFAAVLVVFNHFGVFSSARPDIGAPLAFPRLNFISAFGWVGVEIFFVISGFVIALSARGSSPGEFLSRRALRIFPALWICSCIAAAALATTSMSFGELSLLFLHSVILYPRGPYVDGVIWSLLVEAVFYLLIWLALLTNSFKRLDQIAEILGITSAIFLTIYGLAMLFQNVAATAHIVAILGGFTFRIILFRYGVFFALGMILWLGFEYGFTARRKGFGWLLGLFCAAEIAIQAEPDATQTALVYSVSPVFAGAVPILVWSLAMLALIASVAYRSDIGARLEDRRAWVKNLGLLTFPLYLNHYTIGRVMAYEMLSAHMPQPEVLLILLGIVFGSSWLIMKFAEPALRSGLSHLLKLDRWASLRSRRDASI
jgi:peptidoglycan/LPS O-acetylase OafA/YrhL